MTAEGKKYGPARGRKLVGFGWLLVVQDLTSQGSRIDPTPPVRERWTRPNRVCGVAGFGRLLTECYEMWHTMPFLFFIF